MKPVEQVICFVEEIPEKTRLCLYGAGDYGRSFYELVTGSRRNIDIVCFADSFKSGELFGLPIVPRDRLPAMAEVIDLIVITSIAYQDEIAVTLRQLGLPYAFLNPVATAAAAVEKTSLIERTCYAFYDRAVAPEGFDVVQFLYLAELARMKSDADRLHVVIVPPPENLFVKRHVGEVVQKGDRVEVAVRGTQATRWWERHVLQPCCWMLSSCAGVSFCASREEAVLYFQAARFVYPQGYTLDRPCEGHSTKKLVEGVKGRVPLPSFDASQMAQDFVGAWLASHCAGKKPVVITLRQSPFQPQRNSNEPEWLRFAQQLPKDKYAPIFVRDTSVALTPPSEAMAEFLIFGEASWNMELRLALYELSYLNLFISSGPATFASLDKKTANLVFMKFSDFSFETSVEHIECGGLTAGTTKYPGGTERQRLIWQDDNCDNILREFNAFVATLES